MPGGNLLHNLMIEQNRSVFGALHAQFKKGLRPKRRIRGDGDSLAVCELDEAGLREVRVMFDLEDRRNNLGVAEEIEDQGTVEIADADTAGESGSHERFHCGPGFLDGGGASDYVFSVVCEAWRVAFRRVDVLQGDREMHDVEIEVIDPPVLKLLPANRFNTFSVMERIPQLRNEEELFPFDYAFLDGSRNALAAFYLVPIVLQPGDRLAMADLRGHVHRYSPHAPSNKRYPSLMAL